MQLPEIILAVIAVAVAAGGVTAYYKRSEGQETISLLQANNAALKESLSIKNQRITYLEAQVYEKDQVINKLAK